MSDTLARKLVSAVSTSWNDCAPSLLGSPATLSLLASRDVAGDGMPAALAVAMTWSSAFAVTCSGAASGVLIFLLKADECEDIDRLAKQSSDGLPRPGGRALIDAVLKDAANALGSDPDATLSFGAATYIDLASDEQRLTTIVGESAHIGTFALSVGDDINSQALMLYAPNGSLETAGRDASRTPAATTAAEEQAASTTNQTAAPAGQHAGTRRGNTQRRNDNTPNIERLLEVELDVVVRFGITNVPLRDVVRMGVGTMIELNRAVDEPVELLVNGRPLARGEVVVVDGYYGVRITEIGPASERAVSLG
jgi:flagellar motor switch protein FliN